MTELSIVIAYILCSLRQQTRQTINSIQIYAELLKLENKGWIRSFVWLDRILDTRASFDVYTIYIWNELFNRKHVVIFQAS